MALPCRYELIENWAPPENDLLKLVGQGLLVQFSYREIVGS
jgi:hypothetical protein